MNNSNVDYNGKIFLSELQSSLQEMKKARKEGKGKKDSNLREVKMVFQSK